MARRLRPSEMPQDLEWLLAQCLAVADARNFALTAAHIASACDALVGEKYGALQDARPPGNAATPAGNDETIRA